jgi:hypothetical protein
MVYATVEPRTVLMSTDNARRMRCRWSWLTFQHWVATGRWVSRIRPVLVVAPVENRWGPPRWRRLQTRFSGARAYLTAPLQSARVRPLPSAAGIEKLRTAIVA